MTVNFAYNPFGWSNTIVLFFGIAIMFSFGRRETYMSMLLLGGVLIFLDLYIGFPTIWNGLAGGSFAILVIFIAVLMMIRDRGMYGSA